MATNNKQKNNKTEDPKVNTKTRSSKRPYRGKQGRKDSRAKRVNFDNAREDKVLEDIRRDMDRPEANNIEDWNANSELLRSAGSIPVASITGYPYTPGGTAVPGIMSLKYSPSIGTDSIAINRMFKEMYSFLIHANSRNPVYNASDLGILILAGTEVFVAIEELKRIYGVAKLYFEQNRYYPRELLRALNAEPSNIQTNLGQMWFDINNLIHQSRQIWIPKELNYLKRRIRLAQNIYTDANGYKSQIYVFNRKVFWKFAETTFSTGGGLVPAGSGNPEWVTGNVMLSWVQLRDRVQEMIDALISSEDRGIIYGDILKAYGAENIFAMEDIPSDYIVTPTYNQEILMQIENLNVCTKYQPYIFQAPVSAGDINDFDIAPSWMDVYTSFTSTTTVPEAKEYSEFWAVPAQTILNFHTQMQPSPELVMLASRFKVGPSVTSDFVYYGPAQKSATDQSLVIPKTSESFSLPSSTSSEIINEIWITTWLNASQNSAPVISALAQYMDGGETIGQSDMIMMLRLMAFDWHPFLYSFNAISSTLFPPNVPYLKLSECYGDFDNYTTLAQSEIDKLNTVALYSLFTPFLKS